MLPLCEVDSLQHLALASSEMAHFVGITVTGMMDFRE
jgi:hypothetical protein